MLSTKLKRKVRREAPRNWSLQFGNLVLHCQTPASIGINCRERLSIKLKKAIVVNLLGTFLGVPAQARLSPSSVRLKRKNDLPVDKTNPTTTTAVARRRIRKTNLEPSTNYRAYWCQLPRHQSPERKRVKPLQTKRNLGIERAKP